MLPAGFIENLFSSEMLENGYQQWSKRLEIINSNKVKDPPDLVKRASQEASRLMVSLYPIPTRHDQLKEIFDPVCRSHQQLAAAIAYTSHNLSICSGFEVVKLPPNHHDKCYRYSLKPMTELQIMIERFGLESSTQIECLFDSSLRTKMLLYSMWFRCNQPPLTLQWIVSESSKLKKIEATNDTSSYELEILDKLEALQFVTIKLPPGTRSTRRSELPDAQIFIEPGPNFPNESVDAFLRGLGIDILKE